MAEKRHAPVGLRWAGTLLTDFILVHQGRCNEVRISSRGEYGVRALFDLAMQFGQGPTPLKLIAERQDISEHYLEQLMAVLRKSGLVTSVRGAMGGYELALPPERIRIGDVIRVLEGPVTTTNQSETPGSNDVNRLTLDATWKRIADGINEVLDSITFSDLLQEAERLRSSGGSLMWHI